MYFIGDLLFGDEFRNWFVYISRTYDAPGLDLENNRFVTFIIFAIVSMTFSPIGEEFLYRGLIHRAFVPRFGENKASIIDSLSFALTHLAHFGIVYVAGAWHLYPIGALLWVILMFLVSRVFFIVKQRT